MPPLLHLTPENIFRFIIRQIENHITIDILFKDYAMMVHLSKVEIILIPVLVDPVHLFLI
jgi:hypothetical protein